MNITGLQRQLIKRWGYCPYCLCIQNRQCIVRAIWTANELQYNEHCEDNTNSQYVIEWIEKHIFDDNIDFEINQYIHAFIPVAIVNGTPLCQMHLWNRPKNF